MRKSHTGLVTSQAESAFGEPEKGEQGEHLDPSKTADSSEPLIEVLHLLEKKKNQSIIIFSYCSPNAGGQVLTGVPGDGQCFCGTYHTCM